MSGDGSRVQARLQKYELRVTRQSDGHWMVTGWWGTQSEFGHRWGQDGAPRYFATRREALEFCMTQEGIPT